MLNKSSKRGLNFRKFEGGHFGSWRLAAGLTIFLIVTKATEGLELEFECCPGIGINPDGGVCSDGSALRLDCRSYKYDLMGLRDPNVSVTEYIFLDNNSFCFSGWNSTQDIFFQCRDDTPPPPSRPDENLLEIQFYGVLMIISGIFFVLISMVYLMLPELRSIQDKSIMSMVIFQGLAYSVGSIAHFAILDAIHMICVTYAVVTYWLYLCVFFLMNLVSFNIWRSVWFQNFAINDKNLFRIFCAIVFVGPGLTVIVALVSHHMDGDHVKPGFGDETCFLNGGAPTWVYLDGPLAVLLMLSAVFISLTCLRLWIDNKDHTVGKWKSFRTNCWLSLKLFMVMGISWICMLLDPFVDKTSDFQSTVMRIMNCVTCLQGVILFVLLVATRRRVKILLARKHPCGLSFPKSWAKDDEKEEDVFSGTRVDMEFSVAP